MANFLRGANPIWYFVDLVGDQLNDQFYISFLTNTFPYLPQNVFHDVTGTIPWANPLQFYPNGTLPDNIYFDQSLVYRLEIRRGPTQSDPLIYEVNNYQVGQGTDDINNLDILTQENQLTNPQFTSVFFTNDFTITTAGTYLIAPGWELVLTGTGTSVLTRLEFSGNQGIENNPPFAVKFANSGWTTAILRQRLNFNGAIWNGGAIAAMLLGRSDGASQIVSVSYVPSDAGTPIPIFAPQLNTGNFQTFGFAVDVPSPSTNTDLSHLAYVDFQITLPPTGTVELTNLQLTGQSSSLPTGFNPVLTSSSFAQETVNRQIDHTFNVYANELIKKPKNSVLTGWNFSLNPFQFTDPTIATKVTITSYIADQTILHQEAASQIQSGRSIYEQLRAALEIRAAPASTATRFAIIQYIDPATILPYWSYLMSSLVRAVIFSDGDPQVHLKMRLIYRSTLPPTISNTEPISSWPANSDPVFAAGWTAIAPLDDPSYLVPHGFDTSESIGSAFPALSFNSFHLPDSAPSLTNTLGIVVYTMDNMDVAVGEAIVFDKISLVPNSFAVDTHPETYDESLRKCEFYYEKTYPVGALPGTVTVSGMSYAQQLAGDNGGANTAAKPKSFWLQYKTVKRATPALSIYSPATGTLGSVDITLYNGGALASTGTTSFNPNWTVTSLNANNATYVAASSTALLNPGIAAVFPESFITYHLVMDARLGV